MGYLDSGAPLKRESRLRLTSSRNERHFSRSRPRVPRFLILIKLDYFRWICTVAVFFFFVVIFQLFLPGSVVEKQKASSKDEHPIFGDLSILKDTGGPDFGGDVRFEPAKLSERFRAGAEEVNLSSTCCRTPRRFGHRKPQLAMVFADMWPDPQQILMVTVAAALQDLRYAIQLFSLEDGPVHAVWKNLGVPVTVIQSKGNGFFIDWLNYDGIIVISLEARGVLSLLLQEPFKSLPVLWTIQEKTLATRLGQYNSSGQFDLINDWKKIFSRAIVVFPSYTLPMLYSTLDAGNFFVIPGSPTKAWEVENFMALPSENLRVKMGYGPDDFVMGIVGSPFLYKGMWLEHSLVLKALGPLISDFSNGSSFKSHLKIIVLSGYSTSNYSLVAEIIALHLGCPMGIVKHFSLDQNVDELLNIVDLVIYGSFLDEQYFPEILLKAMSFAKLVIAPNLSMIRKYVDDKVNGYLFPKDNISALTQVVSQVISNRKLSAVALSVASVGKDTARNLNAREAIEGYASLLENVLNFPSEAASPKAVGEIDPKLNKEWQWHLFDEISSPALNRTLSSFNFLDKFEKLWNGSRAGRPGNPANMDEAFLYSMWEEEKYIALASTRKRREEEELKGRTDQQRGTWEEVYRNAKRADRLKNELHERDERELERTGQPLCIYEPCYGEGTWPFLHNTSLYRGIGLSTKSRRPGTDDVDGPARLPILRDSYYRDILGDFGAFFAVANRIDRLHRNAWIGFQSWRATARKVFLSNLAEKALLNAIEARKHGDALYFWVRLDMDPRNPLQQDFWSFCDVINAGNCKSAFSEALRRMYGIKQDSESLPLMPMDGSSWSVMNSWVLPTRSFLEFVMFSRMLVDAFDTQFYDQHHQSGHCIFSISQDKHCYSRVLELLVNVWAYHSARRMVHVDHKTGVMHEHHGLGGRRGQMWIKWFSYPTLKGMDEELAGEADSDHPPTRPRWLWPLTGEVVWQGTVEREREMRLKDREKRQKERKDKHRRHSGPPRQRAIGKYVKLPPEGPNRNFTSR